jgi:AraC-like DNA-binding protein
LLSNSQPSDYRTYGFRFKGSQQQRIAGIHSLGWEKQTHTSYDWDGLTRSELGKVIFQYTLSGAGEITINNQTHRLQTGDAFFVKIPSNHRYYLPADSKQWEFVHLTLFGEEAIRSLVTITEEIGPIIKLDVHSSPIQLIFKILEKTRNNKINDSYEASSYSFSFLMELHRFVLNLRNHDNEWPEAVTNAVHFIQTNYAQAITLEDIVHASNLSKYHFIRVFHKTTHLTPLHYLTKVRINKSIELLKDEELTIEEIAIRVGYSNGNYFSKVFRSLLGLPPGKYRNSKSLVPVDHLILDY